MSKRLLTFRQLLAWMGQVGRKGENICLNLPGRGPAGLDLGADRGSGTVLGAWGLAASCGSRHSE